MVKFSGFIYQRSSELWRVMCKRLGCFAVMGAKGKETIAVVVVTYNRCRLLMENLEALGRQDYKDSFDVIVVDNASTDETQVEVAKLLGGENKGGGIRLIYQNTGANLGGAGGFQYGVRWAVEHGYDYIWLMDDDCMPETNALTALFQAWKGLEGKCGWLSSKVLWTDGSLCTMNVQKQSLTKKVQDFDSPLAPAIMATFVSLFLSAERVREVGLPIKEFFIWSDDFEYTRRISRTYPCYVCNGSVVLHKTTSNVGSNIALDTLERLPRYGYMYRNEYYLYKREGIKGLAYQFARIFLHISRIVILAKSDRVLRLKCLCTSVGKGFTFDPRIEYPSEGMNF